MPDPTPAGGSATDRYRQARDELLALYGEHERAVAEFRWPDIEGRFNFAFDWVDVYARDRHTPGVIVTNEDGSSESRTFAELSLHSDQVARALASAGVAKGDRVVVMLGNQIELWEAMLAVMKLGAVILPTTLALGTSDLADRIERTGARHVITDPADTVKFAEVPNLVSRTVAGGEVRGWDPLAAAYDITDPAITHPNTDAEDPLLLYFTSGTTSKPKLVQHTQRSYPVGHLATMYWIGLRPNDVHLNISSPGWAKHAWSCFFAPLIAEATIYIYNYSRFDPVALLRQMRAAGVTTFCAPPTVWRMLIGADLSGSPGVLREAVAAGEPLNPEVISQVRNAWGLTLRDGFGQTETSALVGNTPGSVVKPGSMGRPLPGCPVELVDPVTGKVADEGEICLDLAAKPIMLMTGYQGDPERNAEAMGGGYYHTGDMASRDAEGYITYIGRSDDVFKASDYKISPFELESVLIEHPAVVEAAVVPAPDPIRLAVPKAYLVLAAGHQLDRATALSILGFAREHLAPFQRLRRIEEFDLPKTISGKIRRVELRARENQLAADGRTPDGEWRDDQFPELKGQPDLSAPATS